MVLGILRTARAAVRACRDAELPDDVDLCLLTWVVIDGPSRGWHIGKVLANSLVGSRVLDHVFELLRREPEDTCIRMPRDGHRTLFDLLTTHLPLDVFTDSLTDVDLLRTSDLFTRLLRELPDRLGRLVIRMIAAQARATNGRRRRRQRLRPDQLDVLVDLTTERFAIGGVAAKRVWALDHQRSLDESLSALRAGAESASTWYCAAPPEHLPPLLDAIGELAVRPAWIRRWLATLVPRAGTRAPASSRW